MLLKLQAAKGAGVPVLMDVGGVAAPIPQELMSSIDILSPNESELSRFTGLSTNSFDEVSQAALKCHKMVSFLSPCVSCIHNQGKRVVV